jgi:glycosyltransferase involved in cell wall biosynthesis
MILLDSIYINNSGGFVLLEYLIRQSEKSGLHFFYLFDKRCEGKFNNIPSYKVHYCDPSIFARAKFYHKYLNAFDKIFCFGNVPPPINVKVPNYTYFHNILFFESLSTLNFYEKILILIKKYYLIRAYNVSNTQIMVQTDYVKKILLKKLVKANNSITVLPFFESLNSSILSGSKVTNPDIKRFTYVSNGNPYKNHKNLIKAWKIVNKIKPEFELHLTISNDYSDLVLLINELSNKGLKIFNHGIISKQQIGNLFQSSHYLIYPSLFESFGLGLIEGLQFKLKVLASNLPYVYSVCKPTNVFNANEPEDIARTVLNTCDDDIFSELKIVDRVDELLSILA